MSYQEHRSKQGHCQSKIDTGKQNVPCTTNACNLETSTVPLRQRQVSLPRLDHVGMVATPPRKASLLLFPQEAVQMKTTSTHNGVSLRRDSECVANDSKTLGCELPLVMVKEMPCRKLKEVMVHEEEVPVIIRRGGCMLRVRITSFSDDEWVSERWTWGTD